MRFITDQDFREYLVDGMARTYRDCQACPLSRHRTNVVLGDGPLEPLLAIIGEAPRDGADDYGVPFHESDEPSRLLRRALEKVEIDVERDAWMTYVVSCQPRDDRKARPEERRACTERLHAEMRIVKPYVILCLGKAALHHVCLNIHRSDSLGKHRGLVKKQHWPYASFGGCGTANLKSVFATYDPAYLIRMQGSADQRRISHRFGQDLRNVKRVLDKVAKKVRKTG